MLNQHLMFQDSKHTEIQSKQWLIVPKIKGLNLVKKEKQENDWSFHEFLFQCMLKAEMNNDPSSLARLSKEIRELSKLIPDFSATPDPEWDEENYVTLKNLSHKTIIFFS